MYELFNRFFSPPNLQGALNSITQKSEYSESYTNLDKSLFNPAFLDLTSKELLIHLTLQRFVGNNSYRWPSIKKLSEASRMSERGVQRVLAGLEQKGYIRVERSKGKKPNRYFMKNLFDDSVETNPDVGNIVHPVASIDRPAEKSPEIKTEEPPKPTPSKLQSSGASTPSHRRTKTNNSFKNNVTTQV